jgi:hypothetical protein
MRSLTTLLSLLVIFAVVALSGAAGRLFGFEEQVSAWGILALAIILALANVFFINRVGNTVLVKWGGVIAYLTFIVGIGFFSVYKAYTSTPPYLIESLAIKTTVHDSKGTSGHIETRAQLKILKGDVKNILWGGLGSTGVIRNVTVTALDGDFTSEVTQEAGEWQLNLILPETPQRGQRLAFIFRFDVINSEPEDETYMVHSVTWPTQNLGITLIVPQERPCKAGEAYSEDAIIMKAEKREEHPPLLYKDNTELQWTKADPQEGRSYIVICHQ